MYNDLLKKKKGIKQIKTGFQNKSPKPLPSDWASPYTRMHTYTDNQWGQSKKERI